MSYNGKSLCKYQKNNKYFLAEPIFRYKKPGSRVILDIVKQLQQKVENNPPLNHDHYLQYQGVEQINGEYCLVTSKQEEYYPLQQYLEQNNPSLSQKLDWALNIARVAQEAESKNCNWSGLTLQSLKIDVCNNIKVIDPEIAEIIKQYQFQKKEIYTANFTPPEIVKNEKWQQKSRLYSFGVILYYFCTERFPFSGENKIDILDKTLNSSIIEPRFINHQLAPELNDLILQLLTRTKDKRIANWKQLITKLQYICHNNLIKASQTQQQKNRKRSNRAIKFLQFKEKFRFFLRKNWQVIGFITVIIAIFATTFFIGSSKPVITSDTTPEQVVKYFYQALNEKDTIILQQTTDLELGRMEGMISEGHVIEKMRQAYQQNLQNNGNNSGVEVFGIKKLTITEQKTAPETVFVAEYIFYFNLPDEKKEIIMKDIIILEYKNKWQIVDIKGDLKQIITGNFQL